MKNQNKLKDPVQYLCFNEYYATGEGMHVWISIESAISEDEAIQKQQKRFKYPNYYIQGAKAYEAKEENDVEIQQILLSYFSDNVCKGLLEKPDIYLQWNQERDYFWGFGEDFAFSMYCNRG